MSVIYRFSYDSPVRYLPLVYLLPYDLISRFPTLRKLPRSMGALNASPEWGEVILSQQFFGEIHHPVVILVLNIEFHAGKFRIVGLVHTLVTEVLADFIYTFKTTYNQSLQIKFRCDAQVKVYIQ